MLAPGQSFTSHHVFRGCPQLHQHPATSLPPLPLSVAFGRNGKYWLCWRTWFLQESLENEHLMCSNQEHLRTLLKMWPNGGPPIPVSYSRCIQRGIVEPCIAEVSPGCSHWKQEQDELQRNLHIANLPVKPSKIKPSKRSGKVLLSVQLCKA